MELTLGDRCRCAAGIAAATMLVASCSASNPRWQNRDNPSLGQRDFDHDLYECTRQAKLHPEWRSPRDMPSATLDPFEGYAEECLKYRGWQKLRR